MSFKRKITSADVLSGSRHLLQFASGILLAKGVMTEEMATLFVGGLSSLVTLGWMFYSPSPKGV